MDPFTWLCGAGVSHAVKLASDLAGDAVEGVFKDWAKGCIERAKLGRKLPGNHDLLRGIRKAHLAALRCVARDYRALLDSLRHEGAGRELGADEPMFADWFEQQVDERLTIRREIRIDDDVITPEDLERELEHLVKSGAAERLEDAARRARQASIERAWQEVLAWRGPLPAPPSHFEQVFRGDDKGGGWYDAFGAFVAEQIKSEERFRSIFFTAKLNDMHALLKLIDERLRLLVAGPPAAVFEWPLARNFDAYVQDKASGFTGRSWLQDDVQRWLREGPQQTMLILAPFGVGKTAFMAHLLHGFRRDGTRTVAHFCRFDEHTDLTPGQIVKSLAAQFKDRVPGYAAQVLADKEAQKALGNAEAEPAAAWSRSIVDPLVRLGLPDTSPPLVMLIDGLDESLELHEAGAEQGGSLLDLIVKGTASRLPRWVRVIMSSRDVRGLGALIQRFHVVDMLKGREGENRGDLERFIRERAQGEHIRTLVRDMAMTEDAFVTCIADLCDGKFLLAHYLLKDAEGHHFDRDALGRVLNRSREIPGMDAFYEEVFKRRVERAKLDKRKTKAILGQVAVALAPLPEAAIAEVLGSEDVSAPDVRRVVDAFSGLLRHDSNAGVTFDHLSIEQWLDPSRPEGKTPIGDPKAGDYAIDRDEAVQRLQAHCKVATHDPQRNTRKFVGYLGRYGVVHLVDAGEIASALSLLMALPLERNPHARTPRGAPPERWLEAKVLDGIDRALAAFDDGDESRAEQLHKLSERDLQRLLESRDYETGKYAPVIRTLIQFHPQAWPEVERGLLEDVAGDLVFRDDIGVSYAAAWHSSHGADRERLLGAIERMAASDNADDREIAGYALKHICQRRHPKPWWPAVEPVVRRLAARYACSAAAVDRMVAGEMLLALAIQGVRVRRWFDGLDGADRFWDPYWPNLRMDIESIRVLTEDDPAWGPEPAPHAESMQATRAQHALALQLGADLGRHRLFSDEDDPASLVRLAVVVKSMAEQQCDKAALDETLDTLSDLFDRGADGKTLVLDLVRRLMLHPSWDLTESGASLVSNLIKLPGGVRRWWLVDQLLASPPQHWRLLYGAVDAAYNAGDEDRYAKFLQAVVQAGRVRQCRVQGICADDLRALLDSASPAERDAILDDAGIRSVLRQWLEEADDMWLLEYLHLIFNTLWQMPEYRDAVRSLLPQKLSRFLQGADGRAFYELGAEEFLAGIERQREAEWRAARN